MARYKYKKPRTFNWVTVFFLLVLLAAGYAAWKFVPPYYKMMQVDRILQDVGYQSSDLVYMDGSLRRDEEQRLLQKAADQIRALGIDDPYLLVQYDADYRKIYATYVIVVKHPFVNKTTELEFTRSGRVPHARD